MDGISSGQFRVVVLVCIVITALNALYVSYRIGYGDGHILRGYPCYVPVPRDFSYDFMRLKIELALLILTITLWFRRVLWFCISVIAALLIEVQYALWHLDTQRWLREMHVSDFSQMPVPSEWPNFAGLYLATPWDFILFVFTTALLVWELRVLIALVTRARQHK